MRRATAVYAAGRPSSRSERSHWLPCASSALMPAATSNAALGFPAALAAIRMLRRRAGSLMMAATAGPASLARCARTAAPRDTNMSAFRSSWPGIGCNSTMGSPTARNIRTVVNRADHAWGVANGAQVAIAIHRAEPAWRVFQCFYKGGFGKLPPGAERVVNGY